MNADNADDIVILADDIHSADFYLLFDHPVDIPDKIEETNVARLLIINGLIYEEPQIGHPLSPSGERRNIIHIPCPGQYHPDKFVERRVRYSFPYALMKLHKSFKPALQLAVRYILCSHIPPGAFRHTEIFPFFCSRRAGNQSYACHIVSTKTDDRRAQHCRKSDILLRIIHNFQIVQDRCHFRRFKISRFECRVGRDSHVLKYGGDLIRPALHCAQ